MPLPEHINKQRLEEFPDSPGVVYFPDHNDAIIYIGKSMQSKQRVGDRPGRGERLPYHGVYSSLGEKAWVNSSYN
jgi:hypothetical protein